MVMHSHKYSFDSKAARGHKHMILGYTEGMVGIDAVHVHRFAGISSYAGHSHDFTGMTGLPVKTPGGHKHKMDGVLDQNGIDDIDDINEMNASHIHRYASHTGDDTEQIHDARAVEVYGQ